MDDHEYSVMRTNTFLSHDVSVHHSVCALCRRKNDVRGVSVYTTRRLQWIAIDCKRNQLQQKKEQKKKWAHFQIHSDAYYHEELGDEGQYSHAVCWSTRK